MPWSSLFHLPNRDTVIDPGLPRRLLRHLFLPQHLGLGGRLLDVGCGTGELTQFLNLLGVEAAGLDERSANVDTARRAAPHLDFIRVDLSQPLPVSDGGFEFVLARELSVHRRNLLSADALAATGNLLAAVAPRGQLVLMARAERDGSARDDWHAATCLDRHLGSFPGTCRVAELRDRMTPHAAVRWMLGNRARPEFRIAALTVPERPISRREWLELAAAAAERAPAACCPWFNARRDDADFQRHAA